MGVNKQYQVAVVGATGAVGQQLLRLLEERLFPVAKLLPLASPRSARTEIEFGGDKIKVQALDHQSFKGIDIALFSARSAISAEYAPLAAQAGAVVIDNTACFRMDQDVPLVVPEVNVEDIRDYRKKNIIANPNCSTIQVVVAVKPIADAVGIERMVVSTYQAVSGAGRQAMSELEAQVVALFNHREVPIQVLGRQLAFNCVPWIGKLQDSGESDEEAKMRNESRKMLHLPDLQVTCTCVRVPIFNGHSAAVNLQLKSELAPERAKALLREAKGVLLVDDVPAGEIPTPLMANEQDATLVGRIRRDSSVPHGLNLFCCADNLRKGAATNAVQIAEILVRDYLN